ncbi:hypothetical protein [Pinibacter soli]|uniref:Uncharacterized protein n=1 Tax=Pinibacter soli TaxID=3044211 RepID=A0ABT6RHU5_9BACT|nr:hypothetical protein [Pinibacter soli]MDI3322152.1 hypothetical protein [Pinibacter soli]
MKVLLLAIFSLYITSSLYAQTSDAEAEAMANLLGVQKKEAISKMVSVAPKDSVAFWKIYDEYAKKNVTTGKARIKLYEQTVQSYGAMGAGTADSLATRYFANRMDQEKTLEEYYQKIKKATNAVTAFEFYQAEVYLLTQIRAQIMQQIPTYGQVQLATKKQ